MKLQNVVLSGLMLLLMANISIAQVDLNDTKVHESKIFDKKQINVILSNYTDSKGFYSHDIFLKKYGLYRVNEKVQLVPCFTISCPKDDVAESNGKMQPGKEAKLLNIDFYYETNVEFNSINKAEPIWDGRAFENGNDVIVGGYSSKFNERPVGKINSKSRFVQELHGPDTKEFPILDIPREEILFDPFDWKLLQIRPSKGNLQKESTKNFLPIDILGNQGEIVTNINFELEHNKSNSTLVLNGILEGKKFELASASLKNSEIIKIREGYQPDLIGGCSQPENGQVMSFTFKGEFSKNIQVNGADLILSEKLNYSEKQYTSKKSVVEIDGEFTDWRNIKGISDYEGDYVSYLYKNPDTDLLEFKISNDDKYLYLYSRVVGAHGRTGEKGRYYWYAYIDVDQNPYTGYPPTRDDNCYFGIPFGDDSEAQFEFIGNKFVKTFFGFTGSGAEKEVLSGVLELGPSNYSPASQSGAKNENYKVEYVNRENSRFITHDYTKGTSEDIIIALSPDGSEVEMKVELAGFLIGKSGKDLIYHGKKIDIAIGAEGSSDHYGAGEWGADSTPVKYGYKIK